MILLTTKSRLGSEAETAPHSWAHKHNASELSGESDLCLNWEAAVVVQRCLQWGF